MVARDFANLDDELRAVQGITGASNREFSQLEETVRRLGATTSFTAQEAGQAAKELARGGQEIAEIQGTLGEVLNLARGTQTNLDFAAASVVRTLGQFGKEVEDTARVVDVLAKATNSGTFVLEDLTESLKFLGPIADSLGFQLEEVSGAFAVLADNGLRGGIAGRQLRRVFFELTNAQKLQRLETELGVKGLVNQNGEFGSLAGTISKIATALDRLNPVARVNIVEEIFGEGAAALEGLAKGTDELNDSFADLIISEGYAQDLADTIDGGLGGATRIAISALRDLSIEIGKIFSQDLINAARVIQRIANESAEWARENKALVAQLLEVGALITAGGVLVTGALAFASALGNVVTAVATTVGLLGSLGFTLAALVNPITIVGAGILAIGAALAGIEVAALRNQLVAYFADAEAAVGRPIAEIDKLLGKIEELNSKSLLDAKQFDELSALIGKVEREFGDAFGDITPEGDDRREEVRRGIDRVAAQDNLNRLLEKLRETFEEEQRLRPEAERIRESGLDRGIIAAPGQAPDQVLRDYERVQLQLKLLADAIGDAREELNALGGDIQPLPDTSTITPGIDEAFRNTFNNVFGDAIKNGGQLVGAAFGAASDDIRSNGAEASPFSFLADSFGDIFEEDTLSGAFRQAGELIGQGGDFVNAALFDLGVNLDQLRREQQRTLRAEAEDQLRDISTRFESGEFGDSGLNQRVLEQRTSVDDLIRQNTQDAADTLGEIKRILERRNGILVGAA